jgi:membrane protein
MKIMKLPEKIRSILSDSSRTFAQTPRKFAIKDWKSALLETKNAIGSKSIGILAAGIAYFLTFAIFPAIAALVATLSFIISPSQLTTAAEALNTFLPSDIAYLISTQLKAALENPSSSVLIIIFGILVALFSLSGAMGNIIKATNAIYDVEESRSFVKLRLVGASFIVAAGVLTVIVVGLLVLNDALLTSLGLPGWLVWTILVLRWFVVAGLVTVGLAGFYRYAPNRNNPHWQWVTWGSLIATVVWLLGTTLFFVYARFFAHYTESYSVFAGIIVLMIWLNLTAFATLLGATINFKLENQTRARTTE